MNFRATIMCGALFAGVLGTSNAAEAATFGIDISFTGFTTSQENIFTAAKSFWETAIVGYQSPATSFANVSISAQSAAIDGVGGILGSAGPTSAVTDGVSPFFWASSGTMNFDSADIGNMEANGSLYSVILHEIAHVLGFGTLWSGSALGLAGFQEVYVEGSGEYTGAHALAAYQSEFDAFATFVPVELDGGPGTANGHWDEAWGGGANELMTGYLNTPIFVSDTTIASFADIGYVVDLTANDVMAPVPLPAGFLLMGSALGLLGMWRRRPSQAA